MHMHRGVGSNQKMGGQTVNRNFTPDNYVIFFGHTKSKSVHLFYLESRLKKKSITFCVYCLVHIMYYVEAIRAYNE